RVEINGSDGSIAFDFERMNELEIYDATAPGGRQGFTRVLTTEPEHPYAEAWWPTGHGLGYEHTFTHEIADLVRAIGEGSDPSPVVRRGAAGPARPGRRRGQLGRRLPLAGRAPVGRGRPGRRPEHPGREPVRADRRRPHHPAVPHRAGDDPMTDPRTTASTRIFVQQEPTPRTALVVRGAWVGYQPVGATDVSTPFPESNVFTVRVEGSPAIYADAEYMADVDLILQCMTMSTIEKEEFEGLRAAVEAGTGLAGWHGGIADSYRNESDYLTLIGGQFGCHPGKHPDERIGEQSDNYVPHTVNMLTAAADHPITTGIEDSDL